MPRRRAEVQFAAERSPELRRAAWDTNPAARRCRHYGVQPQSQPIQLRAQVLRVPVSRGCSRTVKFLTGRDSWIRNIGVFIGRARPLRCSTLLFFSDFCFR